MRHWLTMFSFPKIKIIFSWTYILSPQLSSKLLKGPETNRDLTRLRAEENPNTSLPSGLHGACVECPACKEAAGCHGKRPIRPAMESVTPAVQQALATQRGESLSSVLESGDKQLPVR